MCQWCCRLSSGWPSVFVDLVFTLLQFLAFLFVCFLLLFAFGCWLPALLPGPFVPSDSTPSVWWGVTQMVFSVFVLVPPAFLTCPFVLSGLGVVLSRHVCL